MHVNETPPLQNVLDQRNIPCKFKELHTMSMLTCEDVLHILYHQDGGSRLVHGIRPDLLDVLLLELA